MANAERKMKVSIGVFFSSKEIELDLVGDPDEVISQIQSAIRDGDKVITIEDADGKTVILPVDKIAYCDVHPDKSSSAIGFG